MKRVGVAVAAFVASIFYWTAANAIDTDIGPRWNWSGYYIGVTAGYANANARWTDDLGFTSGNFSGQGVTFGFTGGRNWQNGRWVYGLEGDLSFTNLLADTAAFLCFPFDCRSQLTSFGTLRGRFGYLLNPDLLFFGTAGIAIGKFEHGNLVFASANDMRAAPVLGVGVERKVAPLWTLKAEYLFAPFGGGVACDVSVCGFIIENDKFDLHVFRVGLNRQFGPAGNAPEFPVTQTNRWAGFYVSLFAGYGKSQTEWSDLVFGVNSGAFDGSGALAGLGAGFNWQTGRWVYGLEGDAALAWIKASSPGPICGCLPGETEIASLYTFRGRLGYLVTPSTLMFASGGLALATFKHGNATFQATTAIEPGVTIGTGIEVQAFANWTLKGEYLFAAFGESSACGSLFVCLGIQQADYVHLHVFRFGLNRYF
jgi:outer membrane immunogenic protein